MKFNKPALPVRNQLQKWRSRGLIISNEAGALHDLEFIGYYRFSGYTLHFQDLKHPDKHFKPGTTFEQILELYIFDRELRLLVLDAIERIEVAVRTHIVNAMSVKLGPHWFMEPQHFKSPPKRPARFPRFSHEKFLDKIDEELGIPKLSKKPSTPHNEVFINHYYKTYGDPYLPPAWMVFEVLSMGRLSQVFENLASAAERNAISKTFGVDEQVLQNWLHCLSYVRNLCAHHRRLWNLQLVIKPVIAKKLAHLVPVKDRFYAVAVILHSLLGIAVHKSTWHLRLAALLEAHPVADLKAMEFPPEWKSEPFWGLTKSDYEI